MEGTDDGRRRYWKTTEGRQKKTMAREMQAKPDKIPKQVISAKVHFAMLKRLDRYCYKKKITRQAGIQRALDKLFQNG